MAVGVDSSPRANVERTGISRGAPDTMAPLPLLLRPLNESKRWGGAFVSALSSNVSMVYIRVTSVMFPPRFSRLGRSISARARASAGRATWSSTRARLGDDLGPEPRERIPLEVLRATTGSVARARESALKGCAQVAPPRAANARSGTFGVVDEAGEAEIRDRPRRERGDHSYTIYGLQTLK